MFYTFGNKFDSRRNYHNKYSNCSKNALIIITPVKYFFHKSVSKYKR